MITEEKKLRGYETDITSGTIFAIYVTKIYRDGIVINSEYLRETLDLKNIEELKLSEFTDNALLEKTKKMQDLSADKLILQNEILTHKEEIKAHEENFNIAKSINEEIYAENQKLKSDKEKLLSDMFKLDENIFNLNSKLVSVKVK